MQQAAAIVSVRNTRIFMPNPLVLANVRFRIRRLPPVETILSDLWRSSELDSPRLHGYGIPRIRTT